MPFPIRGAARNSAVFAHDPIAISRPLDPTAGDPATPDNYCVGHRDRLDIVVGDRRVVAMLGVSLLGRGRRAQQQGIPV
jgi:hypothetical protein